MVTSTTIPSSVIWIDNSAFHGCNNSLAINVDEGNLKYSSVDGVLYNKDQTRLIQCPAGKLGSVVIPNSVIWIGDYAFLGCTSLTSATIPNSVIYIGEGAFYGCTGLTSITIPNSVTKIGDSAFAECCNLTSVIIPNSVRRIGYSAFSGCKNLVEIIVKDSNPPNCLADAFSGVKTNSCTLYVPIGCVAAYKDATGWRDFDNVLEHGLSQTIEFSEIPAVTYGDTYILPEYTDGNLPIAYTSDNTDVASINGNTLTIHNAGTAQITASQSGDFDYYPATPVTRTLTVNKAPLTVTTENAAREFGAENPIFTLSYQGFVNEETENNLSIKPTAATTATTTSDAGEYTITCSNGEAKNYDFSYRNGTLTVSKRDLTVTVNDQSREYGDENPAFDVSYSGFVNSNTPADIDAKPNAETTATQNSDAGTYPITITGGSATNYEFLYVQGVLTVNKASLTITSENKQREEGAENTPFTLLYSGFKNSDTEAGLIQQPVISCQADKNSPAGTYTIELFGGSDVNYTYTLVNGVLTVLPSSGLADVEALGISLYPNPVKDYLHIRSEKAIEKVEVYTLSGGLVLTEQDPAERINLCGLSEGVYMVKVYADQGVAVRRIIVAP